MVWTGLTATDNGRVRIMSRRQADIIFFDWSNDGQDGEADHVGIVENAKTGQFILLRATLAMPVNRTVIPYGYYEILG